MKNVNNNNTEKQPSTKKYPGKNKHSSHSHNGYTKDKSHNKNTGFEKKYTNKKNYTYTQKQNETPKEPIVVFAHCAICGAGISNKIYSIKISDDGYTHFECALKKTKEIAHTEFSSYSKIKCAYIGTNTFVIYQEGGDLSWKTLKKVTIKEIMTEMSETLNKTN